MAVDLLDPDFLKILESLALAARRLHRGRVRGEHASFRKGASLEFFDYRRYRPGDDFRYMDWNLYRRLGKVFVKLFTAEEDLTVHILVDISASMSFGNPSKIAYAQKMTAALGYVASANLDRVGVSAFSENVVKSHPPSGRESIIALFDFLSSLQASGKTSINGGLAGYAAQVKKTGLAVVISDLQDAGGYERGLLALKERGFEIIVIHLLSDEEIDPEMSGSVRLVDAETSRVQRLYADKKLLKLYKTGLAAWLNGIERFCMSKGAEYLRASVSVPFEDLILRYLRQGMYLH